MLDSAVSIQHLQTGLRCSVLELSISALLHVLTYLGVLWLQVQIFT